MPADPFTPAELEAGRRAVLEADPSETRPVAHTYAVLSAVAPLIAARVRAEQFAPATVRRWDAVNAVLADLNQVMPGFLAQETHAGECWRVHAGCLAARIRRTLTGEDHPRA